MCAVNELKSPSSEELVLPKRAADPLKSLNGRPSPSSLMSSGPNPLNVPDRDKECPSFKYHTAAKVPVTTVPIEAEGTISNPYAPPLLATEVFRFAVDQPALPAVAASSCWAPNSLTKVIGPTLEFKYA